MGDRRGRKCIRMQRHSRHVPRTLIMIMVMMMFAAHSNWYVRRRPEHGHRRAIVLTSAKMQMAGKCATPDVQSKQCMLRLIYLTLQVIDGLSEGRCRSRSLRTQMMGISENNSNFLAKQFSSIVHDIYSQKQYNTLTPKDYENIRTP